MFLQSSTYDPAKSHSEWRITKCFIYSKLILFRMANSSQLSPENGNILKGSSSHWTPGSIFRALFCLQSTIAQCFH